MLDKNDLLAIKEIMQSEITASEKRTKEFVRSEIATSEERTKAYVRNEMAASEKRTKKYIDSKLRKSENLILNEVDRIQKIVEKKVEQTKKDIEEMKQYYKITKLENDTTTLILKKVEDLTEKVQELERKTA